jgi:signal peptidase I
MKINPIVKEIIEWILCIIIAVVIALLVRYYIGTPTVVESVSMEPTLYAHQRLWVSRWGRTMKEMPRRGEIITFEAPTQTTNIDREDVDMSNPIAKYVNQPQSLWDKFNYYVLEVGKTSYIKRVIALPGEHVQIKDGYVYINGERLQEDYLQAGVVTDMEKGGIFDDFIVPENAVFALGDNRTQSVDCRVFGCIPLEKIESTLSFRFWPLNLFGKVK